MIRITQPDLDLILTDFLGKPYKPRTAGPDTFDCYGLVRAFMERMGVALPPIDVDPSQSGPVYERQQTSYIQLDHPRPWSLVTFVPKTELRPHVGIVLPEDNLFLHCPGRAGGRVIAEPLSRKPWCDSIDGFWWPKSLLDTVVLLTPMNNRKRAWQLIPIDGRTLREIIEQDIAEGRQIPVQAFLGGEPIDPTDWDLIPGPTDQLVIRPELGDGRQAAMVAGMAVLAVFAPYLAGPIAGTTGAAVAAGTAGAGATLAYSLAYAGIMMGGAMALNALVGPDEADKGGSQAYGWNPATTHNVGAYDPLVYGTFGVRGNVIASFAESEIFTEIGLIKGEYVRSARDRYYLKVAYGDGPIEGVIPDFVELSGRRLSEIDPGHITIEHFRGTSNQPASIIPDRFEIPVQTIVPGNHSGPVVKDFYAVECDDVSVVLYFPNGFTNYAKDGSREPSGVNIDIKIREYGTTSWWTVFNQTIIGNSKVPARLLFSISGIGHNNFYDNHIQPFNIVPGTRYEIKVDRSNSTHSDKGDTYRFEAIQIGFYKPQCHPGRAYTAIGAVASEDLNGTIDFYAKVKGKVVQVYDSVAGTWSIQWTDNPAWIAYDLLTRPMITGDGTVEPYAVEYYRRLNPAFIELSDFVALAAWCDELVDDGMGGTEKRYRFNGVIDADMTVWEAAIKVLKMASATPWFNGNKVRVAIDKPATPVQMFNVSNMLQGGFTETWLDTTEAATEYDIEIADENSDYGREIYTVPLRDADRKVVATLDGFGCTSRTQAWRYAARQLLINKHMKRTVEIPASLDAIYSEPGDVVYVQHPSLHRSAGGRIAEVYTDGIQTDKRLELGYYDTGCSPSGSQHNTTGFGMRLLVKAPIRLGTCKVVAIASGNLTVQIHRYIAGTGITGNVIAEKTFATVPGENTLELDFALEANTAGENYLLHTATVFSLQRTDTDINWALYNFTNIAMVGGANDVGTVANNRYYYFFNLTVTNPVDSHALLVRTHDGTAERLSLYTVASVSGPNSDVVTISGVWDYVPQANDLWVFGQTTQVVDLYRIRGFERTGDGQVFIQAAQYTTDYYGDDDTTPRIEPREYTQTRGTRSGALLPTTAEAVALMGEQEGSTIDTPIWEGLAFTGDGISRVTWTCSSIGGGGIKYQGVWCPIFDDAIGTQKRWVYFDPAIGDPRYLQATDNINDLAGQKRFVFCENINGTAFFKPGILIGADQVKLDGIEDGATAGATWGVNIANQPPHLSQFFYQNDPPSSGMNTGDYWLDTNDGNKLYRYNGSTWAICQDTAIQTALTNAATAQATADGKIKTYFQTTGPSSGMVVGDLWFDTDDNNKPYRYSGSAWVAAAYDAADWAKIFGAGKPEDNADVTGDHADDITFTGAMPPTHKAGRLWLNTNWCGQDCVGHWRLNDNAANKHVKDESVYSNHGAAQQNTSVLSAAGKVGAALTFNGTSDHVTVPDHSSLNPGSGDITLVAWIKTSYTGGQQRVLSKRSASAGAYELYLDEQGHVGVYLWDGTSAAETVKTPLVPIRDGNWHFIAATIVHGGDGFVYIDGAGPSQLGTISFSGVTGSVNTAGTPLCLGVYEVASASFFHGQIDNAMVFRRALTAEELDALYNAGAGTEQIGLGSTRMLLRSDGTRWLLADSDSPTIPRSADEISESEARKWAAESGATVGATWGVNITGQPASLQQFFYQNDPPSSGMSAGDYWIDTNDGNKLYRYSGSAWEVCQDTDIQAALADAADAKAIADGRIVSHIATIPPLVGHWKLNDNAASTVVTDSSGRGHTGTASHNTDTLSAAGKISTAFSFNAALAQTMVVPHHADFDLADGGTICLWFKRTTSGVGMLMGKGFAWAVYIDGSGAIKTYANKGPSYYSTGPVIPLDIWTHVAAHFNATSRKIYINGVDVTLTEGSPQNPNTVTDDVYIGDWHVNAPYDYFTGQIDDVRIYSRPLTDGEILKIYNDGAGTEDTKVPDVGDLWIDSGDSNKPYRWSGTAWVAADYDVATWSKIVGSGKPADYADVTADSLVDVFIENFENTNDDYLTRWTLGSYTDRVSIVSGEGVSGGKVLRVGDNSGTDVANLQYYRKIPYDPSKLYRIRVRARTTAGTGLLYLGVKSYTATGAAISLYPYTAQWFCVSGSLVPSAWTEYTGYFTGFTDTVQGTAKPSPGAPGALIAGTAYFTIFAHVNYSTSGITDIDEIAVDIIPEDADEIAESSTKKWAGETGVNSISAAGIFHETFEDPNNNFAARWPVLYGSGELAMTTGGVAGGKVLQIGNNSGDDRAYVAYHKSIPFDPNKLYRLRVRARRVAGTGTLFMGVAGRNSTDTGYVNCAGTTSTYGYHWIAAYGAAPTDWTVYTAFIKGWAATGSNGAQFSDPQAPAQLHQNVRYFRPMIQANYSAATGIYEIDEVSIDIMPEDADQIAESTTKKWAGETGADITRNSNIAAGVFRETFENPNNDLTTRWYKMHAPELTVESGGLAGGKFIRMGNNSGDDSLGIYYTKSIPYDPSKLYRCRIRAKTYAGTPKLYVAISGRNATDTGWVDPNGGTANEGCHYIGPYGQVVPSSWTEYTFYFKGTAATGTQYSNRTDPANPAQLHSNVRYFRPLIYTYATTGGSMDVDEIAIDIMPENADQIAESSSRKWAGETGADVTRNSNIATGLFRENFDDPNGDVVMRWAIGGPGGTTHTGGLAGGKFLRIGDNSSSDTAWMWYYRSIPYDPSKLYRLRIRIRRIAGTGSTLFGLNGRDETDTLWVNRTGSNTTSNSHYASLSLSTEWQVTTFYFKGHASTGGAPSTNPAAPAALHQATRYIRPIALVNYLDVPGITEIDEITLDILPEDADQVPESGTRKWAGETGADKTIDHAADINYTGTTPPSHKAGRLWLNTNWCGQDCVGHWRMNDNAASKHVKDESIYGNSGVAQQNTSALSTTGKVGKALTFNGSTDYINVTPVGTTLDFGTGDLTLAAWIKTTDTVTSQRFMVKRYDTPTSHGVDFYLINDGRISCWISDGTASSGPTYTPPVPIRDGNWHFVGISIDRDGNSHFYVDGVLSGAVSYTGVTGSITTISNLVIGQSSAGSARFNGSIDNFMVFRRALTRDDFDALYNAGAGTEQFCLGSTRALLRSDGTRWLLADSDSPTIPRTADEIPESTSRKWAAETGADVTAHSNVAVGAFLEIFDNPNNDFASRWTNINGTGEVSLVSGGLSGGKVLQIGNNSGDDMRWYIHSRSIPFDPNKLYRIRVRARQTAGVASGCYFGVHARNATDTAWVGIDGSNVNTGCYWTCAAGVNPGSSWVVYTGYLKGTAATGINAVSPNPDAPAKLHTNARYIRPVILVNYWAQPGTVEIDEVSIDIVPDGGAVGTDAIAQGAVVNYAAAYTDEFAMLNTASSEVDMQSLTITTSGLPVVVQYGATIQYGNGASSAVLRLYRVGAGDPLQTSTIIKAESGDDKGYFSAHIHTPVAGTYTYKFTSTGGSNWVLVGKRFLSVTEFKR